MALFFLMSSERSGSNFITKLMNGHSNICGPSTKHIINPVARNLFRYKNLKDNENWEELLQDIHRLLAVDFSVWKRSFSIQDLKAIAPVGDIKSLIYNIFMEEAKANSKQHVFIKENHVYEFLPFLLLNFPESKFVYLVRDPRDMALSWKKNATHSGGVIAAAKQWKKDQQNNLKNHYELSKLQRSYFVKYEDLIEDTTKYTEEIVGFLGLPYDENILSFYKDELTQKNSKKQDAWNNLSKSVITDNKRKYLKDLSQKEILLIEKICLFEMKFLDYEIENTQEQINAISNEEIEDFDKEEQSVKNVQPKIGGVQENMHAKKIFYEKMM